MSSTHVVQKYWILISGGKSAEQCSYIIQILLNYMQNYRYKQ